MALGATPMAATDNERPPMGFGVQVGTAAIQVPPEVYGWPWHKRPSVQGRVTVYHRELPLSVSVGASAWPRFRNVSNGFRVDFNVGTWKGPWGVYLGGSYDRYFRSRSAGPISGLTYSMELTRNIVAVIDGRFAPSMSFRPVCTAAGDDCDIVTSNPGGTGILLGIEARFGDGPR